jgi:hypothetical protein
MAIKDINFPEKLVVIGVALVKEWRITEKTHRGNQEWIIQRLVTLSTKYTGRRQIKHITQHTKLNC